MFVTLERKKYWIQTLEAFSSPPYCYFTDLEKKYNPLTQSKLKQPGNSEKIFNDQKVP